MNITDEGLRAISEMTWLEGLYDVGGLASDAGLAHLAELSHLEVLLVDSQKTTREGKPVPSPISDAGLAVLSHLPSLTYLALGGGFTDATMTHVATLPNLRILYILHVPISDAGLRHLSSLTRLERLSLSGTPQATDAGLAALLSLHSLKQLNISLAPGSDPQRITDRALVTLSRMHSLESLSITNNDFLSDENIPQLAQLPRLKRLNISTPAYIDNAMDKVFYTSVSLTQLTRKGLLEELSIGGAGVNDKTIGILTQLPHLRKLDLMTYNLTDAGVRQLAALRSLEGLVIHNRRISIGALNSLNALPNLRYLRANTLFRGGSQSLQIGNLTHLETLILSMDFREPQPWCDADLACLSSMTKMGDLQLCGIDNRRSQVTDQGLASLAPLTSLWRLSIRTTRLTNEGLVHLHGLRQLEDLYISGDFGNAGLDQLASLASLRILEISNNRGFSAQSLDQLKARLPNLQLLTIPNNPAP
jgi:hypothetical protein